MGWREVLPGKYHEVSREDMGHSLSTHFLEEYWGPRLSQGHWVQKGALRPVLDVFTLYPKPDTQQVLYRELLTALSLLEWIPKGTVLGGGWTSTCLPNKKRN